MTQTTPLDYLNATVPELGPARKARADGPWRSATDEDGVFWLLLDVPGTGANTISGMVLEALDEFVRACENNPPKALVIRSAKPAGFAAGADINEFSSLIQEGEVNGRLRAAHEILDRLERLPCPTIAVVHGAALGAGFELALACDYRLAVPGAHFGFPEVRLGLHPGLGGTFRLTRLIDPTEAMTLMLTGKSAHTDKARHLGIIDAVVEERHVSRAVRAAATGELEREEPGLKDRALALAPARKFAARQMRSKTEQKAPQAHYPAPYQLIDLWEAHGDDELAMQKAEIESFARLLDTETATNLRRVFFLRQTLKQAADGTHGINHIHVVGAGAMGADIAGWAAVKGLRVTLEDVSTEPLGAAVARLVEMAEAAHLSPEQIRDAVDRMMPDPSGYGVTRADLVIEAAPEQPALKTKIYSRLEARMKKEAILVSNTSSLSLKQLAAELENPGRFAGLHFFNPVHKMQLVEVVAQDKTEQAVLNRLTAFCGSIDRLPVALTDYPGFLVNRALTPYLLEAMVMLEEGIPAADIDKAAETFGFPMGPVELADRVGLDICLAVARSLKQNLDKPLAALSERLTAKVEAGKTGQKSGEGLYLWADGKPDKGESGDAVNPEWVDRLVLPMLDACVECLRCQIVADRDTLDAALIFATGFAPFRGGPLHYAQRRGTADIRERLAELAQQHGARFEPDPGWSEL